MTELCEFPLGRQWVVCIRATYLDLRSRQHGRVTFFFFLSCDFHPVLIGGVFPETPSSVARPEAEGKKFETDQTSFIIS